MKTGPDGECNHPIEPGDSAIIFDLSGAVHLAVPRPKPVAEHIVPPSAIIAAAMYLLMGCDQEWFGRIMEMCNKIQEDLGPNFSCRDLVTYTNDQYAKRGMRDGDAVYDDGKDVLIYHSDPNFSGPPKDWKRDLKDLIESTKDDEDKSKLN